MKTKFLSETNQYLLLIEKGEPVIETLIKIAKKEQFGMANFTIIGALTDVNLGYVDQKTNQYVWKEFSDQYELISADGNITWDYETKEPLIHTHISMGDHGFNTISGHLKEAKVALIGEVIINIISHKKIFKKHDPKTDLQTWDI